MKLTEIREMVAGVDPNARHYVAAASGEAFTRWQEYEYIGNPADDTYGDGWKFQIDRFTKTEFDEVAEAIKEALKKTPGLAFTYMREYEQDSGYIHHIFDCEAP